MSYLDFKDVEKLNSREEIIVSDWDGVIQHIDVAWAVLAEKNRKFFEGYFDESKYMNKCSKDNYADIITERDTYYINKWMMKEGVEPDKEKDDLFVKLYTDCPNFYELCPFTPFAEGLGILSNQSFCSKIVFLSHVPASMENGYDKRKEEVFKKFLSEFSLHDEKCELVMIPHNVKKSEWIKENLPNYTTFVDDRADIIEDVIDNTDSNLKTFLMPLYGYGLKYMFEHREFYDKVRRKSIKFHYIKNVFNGRKTYYEAK